MSSLSSNWASILGGTTILKCSNTCSCDIPIIIPKTFTSYANCTTLYLMWLNFGFFQYVHCSLNALPIHWTFSWFFFFKSGHVLNVFIMSSHQSNAMSTNINASSIFLFIKCIDPTLYCLICNIFWKLLDDIWQHQGSSYQNIVVVTWHTSQLMLGSLHELLHLCQNLHQSRVCCLSLWWYQWWGIYQLVSTVSNIGLV